jgi:hypothetical protein
MVADANEGARRTRTLKISVKEGFIWAELQPDDVDGHCAVELDPLAQQTISTLVGMLRENRLLPDEYPVLGANLYEVIFGKPEIEQLLEDALDLEMGTDLRIELEFDDERYTMLAGWPWEYLYHPAKTGEAGSGQFLAERTKLVLTRRLRPNRKKRSLRVAEAELPLRVLFVAPSPRDLDPVLYTPPLEQLLSLEESLQTNGRKDRLEVWKLVDPERVGPDQPCDPTVTWDAFANQVDLVNPHLIHFVGHGEFRDGAGWVAFDKVDGNADWVKDVSFGNQLEPLNPLRLVLLQACESGRAGVNPYQAVSGVAMQLANRNIPAVVAMQDRVANEIANRFATSFYQALAAPSPVDLAVRAGRLGLGRPEEFDIPVLGLPVLYLRDYELLWDPRQMGAPPPGSAPPAGPTMPGPSGAGAPPDTGAPPPGGDSSWSGPPDQNG